MTSDTFDKYHLMRDEEFQRLRQKQVQSYSPELRILTRLDDDMKEILSDTNVPVDVKLNIFNQLQQRIKDVQAMTRPVGDVTKVVPLAAIPTPVVEDATAKPKPVPKLEPVDMSPLTGVATRSKKNATELLTIIQQQPSVITKNENDELVLNGNVIKGSNFNLMFKSLYSPSVSDSSSKPDSTHAQFLKALNKIDVPLTLISNPNTRSKLFDLRNYSPGATTSISLESTSNPTVAPRKRPGKQEQGGNGLTPGKVPTILRVYRA